MKPKAIILSSGGLDSTTCLAMALDQGYECFTISFDYGQKQRAELTAATLISKKMGAKLHRIFKLPIGDLGGSALTDANVTIPDYEDSDEIPITYVPARNTIFLSIALGWAEILQAYDIFIGVSAIDYSHYPDCRPEYIAQFQTLTQLATKASVHGSQFKIHTPIIHLSKAQTIQRGIALGVDYHDTISCYRANEQGQACGTCASCTLRKKGFREAGIADPTRYVG